MPITGNKGEWSEIYAFLRLLADGKLFAADENLNRIENMFFPVVKIIREETAGVPYEYKPAPAFSEIEIWLNGVKISQHPATVFKSEADGLYNRINSSRAGKRVFEIGTTEAFMRGVHVKKLKVSPGKSDIDIQIHDVNTGFENVVGFSIKSKLGLPSTLLNAGGTTNFVFRVDGLDSRHVESINRINTKNKLIARFKAVAENSGRLVYVSMQNDVFHENLIMIDSQMPHVVAHMLLGYYEGVTPTCVGLTEYVCDKNPLSRSDVFYRHKIKEMLCAVALGMKPSTRWDGTDEASGGYIIVKTNGDVLAYHIYNRNAFKNYLLNNTKFERASSTRHGYGTLYEDHGAICIKLNLQIRFM